MKRRISRGLLAALALLALTTASVGADEAYSKRTLEIARQLNCPICQGETVADSRSPLAAQMRGIIEQKVQAGESTAQIKEYFRQRYGTTVLAEPPRSGLTLMLWWLPVVAVVMGAVIVALYLRERTRGAMANASQAPSSDDAELEAIAREVLGTEPLGTAAQ